MTTTCQQGFRYNEIVSCNKEPLPPEAYNGYFYCSRHQPFYELKQDGSGMPFENIMEMRSAKIRNFLETRDYPMVIDFMSVQYEKLLALGTKTFAGSNFEIDRCPLQVRSFSHSTPSPTELVGGICPVRHGTPRLESRTTHWILPKKRNTCPRKHSFWTKITSERRK